MAGDAAPRHFVSRSAELAVLRAALARAVGGHASSVLVAGDAGVGKTRLVVELAAQARAHGATVLVGHCIEVGEGELPYAPVSAALRSLAAQYSSAGLDEILGPARGELARLMPDLGETDDAADPADAFATARLFELLLGVLGRAGDRAPVLLVVEDLHWTDGSTRDLLRFLVRAASAERLALVLTYRSDELHRTHPLRPYVAELAREPRVDRVELRPFTREEFVDYVDAIRGVLPSPTVLDRLFERSEGNAFYTEELLAAMESDGPDALPASVRDAMVTRLERLSPATHPVLRVLAAAGRRVDPGLLAAASGVAEGELAEALREAVARQVVTARGGTYEFRHALLREAAYEELLPGEREPLHAALAAELQKRTESQPAGATPHAELAYHWHAAGALDRALAASVRAGEQATRVYAHPEALRHFQRALEVWDRVPPAAHGGLDLAQITASAAEAANATGEHQLAIALTTHAIELVDARAEPLRAGVLRSRLAQFLLATGRGDEARTTSAQALAVLPPEPTPERARVLSTHARLLLMTARIEAARAPLEEALAIARGLGLRALEADALSTSPIALHGRTEATLEASRAALATAREVGEPVSLLRAHHNAAEALDQAGRLEDAIDVAREGIEVARSFGVERVQGVALKVDVGDRLVRLGRLDEAAAALADALRAAPSGTLAASLHGTAALIAARRGDVEGAAGAARLARSNTIDAGGGQWSATADAALAEVALWASDAERARVIVDDALSQVAEAEFLLFTAKLYALGGWAHADLALRARALRRDAEASTARAAIVALQERFDVQLVGPAPPEPAAYRLQLTAELGRLDDPPDAKAWEAARRAWENLGFRFEVAVCRWREAEARLATDADRMAATELLRAAHRETQALGARPLHAEVEALARRARIALGGPPAAETSAEAAAETDLTAREVEVLSLVADGLTNREIGSKLFISEKTVSVHVSRILAKLGAANRAHAATLAHRLGIRTAKRRA